MNEELSAEEILLKIDSIEPGQDQALSIASTCPSRMKKVNLYLEAKHIPWKWRETARCPYTTALLQDAAVTAADEASDMVERTREAVSKMPQQAFVAAQRAKSQLGRAANDADVRDQVLLGVAGLAVAAALSMAYQRR